MASFEEDQRHRSLRDLLAVDLRYWEIPTYREMLLDIEAGRPQYFHGALDSRDSVDRYWEGRIALIESMRTQGYDRSTTTDDAGVAIARDGSLLKFTNGNHRFAIARLLGVDRIPVRVRVVHADWVEHDLRGCPRSRRRLAERFTEFFEERSSSSHSSA